MDEVLERTHEESKAKQVMAVMLDARNGGVVGISQTPHVNFNKDQLPSRKALMNQILQAVYEPGSTIKPIVMAAAMERGLVADDEIFKCSAGSVRIGRKVIRDVHSYPLLTPRDIIIRSSNIGMSQVGLRFGKENLYNALREFSLGEKISLGLPGASAGILRHWKSWAEVDMATHAFGQGVAVTPLQMLGALSAIANGGVLPQIHIREDQESVGKRVISEEVSAKVKEMLVAVVEDDHGTGTNAKTPGVLIGGKTGTAQKASAEGGYQQKAYIASFLGFADTTSAGLGDILALYVIVDEPNNGKIYGGVLAAPAFQEIIEKTLRVLQARKAFSVGNNG
jgi:cell division protein FtsI (penicillin-binding protein 3)